MLLGGADSPAHRIYKEPSYQQLGLDVGVMSPLHGSIHMQVHEQGNVMVAGSTDFRLLSKNCRGLTSDDRLQALLHELELEQWDAIF